MQTVSSSVRVALQRQSSSSSSKPQVNIDHHSDKNAVCSVPPHSASSSLMMFMCPRHSRPLRSVSRWAFDLPLITNTAKPKPFALRVMGLKLTSGDGLFWSKLPPELLKLQTDRLSSCCGTKEKERTSADNKNSSSKLRQRNVALTLQPSTPGSHSWLTKEPSHNSWATGFVFLSSGDGGLRGPCSTSGCSLENENRCFNRFKRFDLQSSCLCGVHQEHRHFISSRKGLQASDGLGFCFRSHNNRSDEGRTPRDRIRIKLRGARSSGRFEL